MKDIIFSAFGIIVGLAILFSGLYFFKKDASDRESAKIYTAVSVTGAVITLFSAAKMIIF